MTKEEKLQYAAKIRLGEPVYYCYIDSKADVVGVFVVDNRVLFEYRKDIFAYFNPWPIENTPTSYMFHYTRPFEIATMLRKLEKE